MRSHAPEAVVKLTGPVSTLGLGSFELRNVVWVSLGGQIPLPTLFRNKVSRHDNQETQQPAKLGEG